jgi:hypothetical protein
VLGTLPPLMLKEPGGPAEPPARLRAVPPTAVVERQPERAPRGPPDITSFGMQLLGTLQRPQAVLHAAEEVGRSRQQLKILRSQGGELVGQRECGVGIRPNQPLGGLTTLHQRTLRAHRTLASSRRPIRTLFRSENEHGSPCGSPPASTRKDCSTLPRFGT